MAQGKDIRRGGKIRSQNIRKSTVKHSLREMAERTRLNKGNINEHINMGRRHFQGVLPQGKDLEATNDCWEES